MTCNDTFGCRPVKPSPSNPQEIPRDGDQLLPTVVCVRDLPWIERWSMSTKNTTWEAEKEKAKQSCWFLFYLQVLFALNQTLWQHEHYRLGEGTMPYTTNDLITHYNCGDLNTVIYNHDTAQVNILTGFVKCVQKCVFLPKFWTCVYSFGS